MVHLFFLFSLHSRDFGAFDYAIKIILIGEPGVGQPNVINTLTVRELSFSLRLFLSALLSLHERIRKKDLHKFHFTWKTRTLLLKS